MNFELVVISVVSIFLIIIVIKPFREILIWFITDIFVPACKFAFNYFMLYGLKVLKDIFMSHAHIIKNMFVSRAVIFPKNEDMRHERDKAMNRKI